MEKIGIFSCFGMIVAFITDAFGGWSESMTSLVIFMSIDYITGLMVAGLFKKSNKTEDGGLESRAGWKGLARKFSTLLVVLIGVKIVGVDKSTMNVSRCRCVPISAHFVAVHKPISAVLAGPFFCHFWKQCTIKSTTIIVSFLS